VIGATGSFLATAVTRPGGGGSPFTPDTQELFRQFEEDYKNRERGFTLDPKIAQDIHEQTAGSVALIY